MKTLIVSLLLLTALPAVADSRTAHLEAGRASRDLVAASRQLDVAAHRLFADLRHAGRQSGVAAEARDLARATGELRVLAERGARPGRVHDAWRDVQARHADLERRLLRHGRLVASHGHRGAWLGSLREVDQGLGRTARSLARYTHLYRDRGPYDRHGHDADRRHPRLGAVSHDDGVRHLTH